MIGNGDDIINALLIEIKRYFEISEQQRETIENELRLQFAGDIYVRTRGNREARVNRARSLQRSGLSVAQISNVMQCSKPTIYSLLKI